MTQCVSVYSASYSDFWPYTATFYTEEYTANYTASRPTRRPPTHHNVHVHMHMHMSETTATFLAKRELSSYTAAFDEHGWDSLPALQEISPTMSPTMGPLKQLVMVACEGLPCPL